MPAATSEAFQEPDSEFQIHLKSCSKWKAGRNMQHRSGKVSGKKDKDTKRREMRSGWGELLLPVDGKCDVMDCEKKETRPTCKSAGGGCVER